MLNLGVRIAILSQSASIHNTRALEQEQLNKVVMNDHTNTAIFRSSSQKWLTRTLAVLLWIMKAYPSSWYDVEELATFLCAFPDKNKVYSPSLCTPHLIHHPMFCAFTCPEGHCCSPSHARTLRVIFRCPQGRLTQHQETIIESCSYSISTCHVSPLTASQGILSWLWESLHTAKTKMGWVCL